MLHINEGELIIKETGEHHKLNDTIIPTVLSNSYVFCMTYIDPKNDKFEFDDEQKEGLRNFGDAALVILDSEEFFSRIKKAAEEFSLVRIFRSQVFPQELDLYYYPELKEDVSILIKEGSKLTYKLKLLKECKDICGYLFIYEDNILIYQANLYPCWVRK